MIQIDEIIEKLWDPKDSKYSLEEFQKILETLLRDAQVDEDIHRVICFLLNNFQYYSEESVNSHLITLHKKLTDIKQNEDTLFTYIKKKGGEVNSSSDYAYNFKHINRISSEFFTDDIKLAAESGWDQINTIVLVDDCSGTGETLCKFIKNLGLSFAGKTLYYLVIHQMTDSNNKFQEIMNQHSGFTIHCISIHSSLKAFKNTNISPYKKKFICFSKQKKINEFNILGYNDSEAIFAFYNNTPNNTFGIFHSTTEKNKALFPRDKKSDKKPFWQRKTERQAMLANNAYTKNSNKEINFGH